MYFGSSFIIRTYIHFLRIFTEIFELPIKELYPLVKNFGLSYQHVFIASNLSYRDHFASNLQISNAVLFI